MGQLMEDVVSTANNVAENFNRILISHLGKFHGFVIR